MVTLTVYTVDAETDKPVPAFTLDGKTVNVSIIVLPSSAPPPSGGNAQSMVDILAGDPNNAPLGPQDAPDKQATLSPAFSPYGGYLSDVARIYRVPVEGLTLDLGVVGGNTSGWWIGVIPAESDVYEFAPLLFWVDADLYQGIYGYRKDLSSLAREVLEKRAKAKAELVKLSPEWGGSLTAVPWPVLQMVHNYVENALPPKDARLAAYWVNDLSWAVLDFAIPAREFDLLVDRYGAIHAIIEEIPWPDIPHFETCAQGLPFYVGKDGDVYSMTNWRLCVPTFSDYFPRSDNQIRMDMATLWLAGPNFALIIECIIKHIQDAEAALKKKARIMKIVGLVAPILIMPSPATIIAAITDAAAQSFLKNSKWYVSALFDLATGAAMALLGGGVSLGGWEQDLIKSVWDKSIDLVKLVVQSGNIENAKQLADDAAKLGELNAQPKEAAALAAAGEVLGSMSEEQTAMLFKAVQEGASFPEFVQMILETKNLPPVLLPWLAWCLGHSGMGIILAGVFALAKEIGALMGSAWGGMGAVDPQGDVTLPLIGEAQAAGVSVPAGTVALLNGDNPAFPQQPVTAGGAVAGATSIGGTVALLTAIGYGVSKGLIR